VSRVLVTRPAGQATELVMSLLTAGVEVVHVPTVQIMPENAAELTSALRATPAPAWLVITSANSARMAARALKEAGGLPAGCRIAVVGPATARALRRFHLRVDHVPERYLTSAIATGLGDVAGRRVILARAAAVTAELRTALAERGALVEELVAYRTVEGPASSRVALCEALDSPEPFDLVTFTSGSTVRGLVALLDDKPDLLARARAIPAACIGPVTAREAQRLGFVIRIVSTVHTASALAEAIVRHIRKKEPAA
jgi:uroporphyrinogen-III synthase